MKKIVSFFTLLLLGLSLVASAQAQDGSVKGKITDPSSNPLESVTISIKGKAGKAVVTNARGEFEIKAKSGDIIQISSVGFKSEEVKVNNINAKINVTLKEAVNQMDEVIVTAGGIKTKRKEIGTTGTIIKADNLVAGKAVNIAGGLQGKVAGLQINATNGGVNPSFRIVLRGQRSLTGNNQALIVLDNVIVPSEVLGNLNPEDVADVNVLNGAGAAALYGSSASNGAIIVTTKKGKKGTNAVTVSQTMMAEHAAFFPKFQMKFGSGGGAYGYNDPFAYYENQSYGPAFDGTMRVLGAPLEDGSQDSTCYCATSGHSDFWETGMTQQTDFSVSGGDDNSTFYMAGQYADITGTTPGDKYNRTTFRLNGTRKVGNKINVSYNTNYTQNRYDITTATGSVYDNMLNMPNNVEVTRYKDFINNKFATFNDFYNPWYVNPYWQAAAYRSGVRNDYLVANFEIKYSPIKGLDLVARQGLTTRNASNKDFNAAYKYTAYRKTTESFGKSDVTANVSDGSSYSTNLLSDVYSQYQTKYKDFTANVIAGGQFRQDQSKGVGVSGAGLVVPNLFNVANGVGTPGASESNSLVRQFGFYADARFGYKGYAFLHATGRRDWVSILDPEHNTFFYPAVDVSFIASDAIAAIKNSKTINYLKVRAGWSKVGQANLGAYALKPTFGSTAYGFPYGTLPGYTVGNSLVSNSLKPEITSGYEVGFDMNLFKDKITSSITYFSTITDDQTVSTAVSTTTGFTAMTTNTGQTYSKGLEATLHVTPIDQPNGLRVTIGGNYTYLDNKVNFISSALPRLALATYGDGTGAYAVAGQTFPMIMGFDYKRDADGRVIVNSVTGIPTKSDTISYLGGANPVHKLGLDGSVEYKKFRLSITLEYRGGYSAYQSMGSNLDWSGTSWRTAIYDRKSFIFPNSSYWDGTKYVANTAISIGNGNGNNGYWTDGINRGTSTNYMTSGDFWKVREVALSYDLPTSVIGNKIFKGVTVSVQGRNLFVFMAKDNYYSDPEYSDAGSGSNGMGLTGMQSPPSRFYGASIKFKF